MFELCALITVKKFLESFYQCYDGDKSILIDRILTNNKNKSVLLDIDIIIINEYLKSDKEN